MQAVGGDTAQTRETMGRLLDLVTVNGGGDEELKQALGGVRDVINKNKLMGDDLKQLMTAGVNMKTLARSIGANFKISAKDDDELVLKVQKAISHGQIRGQLAVKSINDAIANQTGKGAAGQAAFDLGSSTISGLSWTMYLKTRARTTPSTMASGTCVRAKTPRKSVKEPANPPTSAGYASASSSDVTTYVTRSARAEARKTVANMFTDVSLRPR